MTTIMTATTLLLLFVYLLPTFAHASGTLPRFNGTLPTFGNRYVISKQTRCVGNKSYIGTFSSPAECDEACRLAGTRCYGFNVNVDAANPREYGECGVWGENCTKFDVETHAWYRVAGPREVASLRAGKPAAQPKPETIETMFGRLQGVGTVLKQLWEVFGKDYVAYPGKTCYGYTSDSLLGYFPSIKQCFENCQHHGPTECYGFNMNANVSDDHFGWCTVWATHRCRFAQASSHILFRPKVGAAPITKQEPPNDISGFVRINKTACSGGSSYRLEDWSTEITECSKTCREAPRQCGGINFNKRTGECIVRSINCVEFTEEDFVFYRFDSSIYIGPISNWTDLEVDSVSSNPAIGSKNPTSTTSTIST